jgi:serine/threonine-protein kinase
LLRRILVATSTNGFPSTGEILSGKYVLRECIGAGGMGSVFLADDPALARRVAIKIHHPHLAARACFVRRLRDEAIAASRVQHRGKVAVLDTGVTPGGTPFIAMELAPGRPLGQILSEQRIPLRRGLGILDQLLAVLDAAHACSVVHADVKSDNVMVEQQPDGDAVTLIDFGLAYLGEAPAGPAVLAGTPEYMAPELIRGAPPTSASDLYGAGVILYELLTGATPFAGSSTSRILHRQIHEAVLPPSRRMPDRDIPAALDQITLRVLAKDPRDRFASAQELRDALANVALGLRAPTHRLRRAAAAAAARDGAATLPRIDDVAPPEPGRIPRGSETSGAAGGHLRRAIAIALARGAVPEIAECYAALAAALVRERQLGAAICELEEGIDVVSGGRGSAGAEPSEPVSRLVASLAALYELVGQPGKARRALACVDGRVTLVVDRGQPQVLPL